VPTPDTASLRAALELQQSALLPIGLVLAAVATFPPRLRPEDWRGEAATACERLGAQLREQLRAADTALSSAQRDTRSALRELGV
jgi:hypothetical protein